MVSKLVFALAFALVCTSGRAEAQTSATLAGVVQDANGNVLGGTTVTATQVDTGVVRTIVAGADGRFIFSSLPPGAYQLRAEHVGFSPLVRTGVRLTVSEQAAITLVLQIGVSEEITVAAGTPLSTRVAPRCAFWSTSG